MSKPESALTVVPPPPGALQTRETSGDVLAAQAKALVEARYIVAMKQPRDLDTVREKLLKECRRPGFAAVARYRKPVGQGVEGPSIRFAEAAIRCMTNMTPETITVYDDNEKRIVRVAVTDLEANVTYSQDVTIQKTVERRSTKDGDTVIRTRTNSQGKTVYILEATDDDILNKQNALISKALRTLGLRIVPGDIVEECMDLVIETLRKKDAADPNAAKKALLDAFSGLGIKVEQVKEYLGHDGETLQPKELLDLRALFTAIKDGEATWREAMEARGMAAPAGEEKTLTERLKEKAAATKTETANTGGPPDEVKAAEGAAQEQTVHETHGRPAGAAAPNAPAAATGRQRRF